MALGTNTNDGAIPGIPNGTPGVLRRYPHVIPDGALKPALRTPNSLTSPVAWLGLSVSPGSRRRDGRNSIFRPLAPVCCECVLLSQSQHPTHRRLGERRCQPPAESSGA